MTKTRDCENCGAALSTGTPFCRDCGAPVQPVAVMKCQACSDDNPADAQFCGGCGKSLKVSAPGSASHGTDPAGQDDTPPVVIPDDAVVVRQSSWAYMLLAVPWFVLFGVSLAFDFFTFGILPAVFATYFIGSRYLSFRRTAYILTDTHVIIQQGSLIGQHRADLSFADLSDVQVRPGTVGNYLGYTSVTLQLKDGRMVSLHYVPSTSSLPDQLKERVNSQCDSKKTG